MTPAEFKTKWARYQGKEASGYQGHFDDLCRMLGLPTPAEADPSGTDFFCFQKHVVKDVELSGLSGSGDRSASDQRGFADVWKKGCFAWEYKGKKKNLEEAYRQLLRYRESLLNPPLLVVCDFDRFIVRTNFNGTVQETHEFTNDQIDRPENLRVLRAIFESPEFLKPQRTTAQVTERLAAEIAEIARLLQSRETVELADAKTRKQVHVAQKKNLRIARFLNRMVFCFFAEDTGLLPKTLFRDLLKASVHNPGHLTEAMEQLFRVMAKGGLYGPHRIRHFNGHLFEDSTVFELAEPEIAKLAEAAESDWQFIEPSIMGNLFERGLDPDQRAQLGAHYTSEADIRTLVEPVLMAPLRREWAAVRNEMALPVKQRKGTPAQRERLTALLKHLSSVTVLDPACGSGNFLYVSLHLLLNLEKEIITFATQLGFKFEPQVGVHQLKAIEINAYAYELAQVAVQIGYLQWRRDNGFDNDRSPVLRTLNGFENKDALLHEVFRKKPKNLKEARHQEHHHTQDELFKVYVERAWPECDVIVGNPPFLGGKLLRRELGDAYVSGLFENFGSRVPPEADLCCYWFEKSRELIEQARCKRAGLLATQGIRGGANREVLRRIKESGDIFFAISDREWILAGANVHISMVGFDSGTEASRELDASAVNRIGADLKQSGANYDRQARSGTSGVSFMGITPAGPFDLGFDQIQDWLSLPNPSGAPNSDVLRPYFNGNDITKRPRGFWTIDFGVSTPEPQAAFYERPFQYLERKVKPLRARNRRAAYAENWWIYAESRPAMRRAFAGHTRYLATCMVAKHRTFVWLDTTCLPANVVIVFARSDDYFLGILQSKFHILWALSEGTRLETRPRYTPTTCFETFPFPFQDDLQMPTAPESPAPPRGTAEPDCTYSENLAAKNYFIGKEEAPLYGYSGGIPDQRRATIAAAARELNDLRERWLNPPEWTVIKTLEFPGTAGGPWSRYIDPATIVTQTPTHNGQPLQIGTVRYPRIGPRDADSATKLRKRTLTNLYNERPAWLDLAHKKLDAAVAQAYGWPADLSDSQILERLLKLNLERAEPGGAS